MDAAALLGEDMDEWLWPESCLELRQMESSLRCLICGDFFHGPVLLPCTHTFCSECVRRFLQTRGANGCCPECKQPCAPSELVPNRSLEKIGMLFQQMKPTVLPVLATAKPPSMDSATPAKRVAGKGSGDGKPPERVSLLSYSVMKEKDIKKLLESIGIRAPIKNREDIIQIHKEYVLLANAQADSSHPKSAKQVRDEVMRNYRARQVEKAASGRKSTDAGATPVVSVEMQAGFERLRQQVKARGEKMKAKQAGDAEDDGSNAGDGDSESDHEDDGGSDGVWRHVHALQSDQQFYIHSFTNEIRLEAPREFVEHQRRLKEAQTTAEEKGGEDEFDVEPVVVHVPTPVKAKPVVTTIGSDDDENFVMITSPPPKPPLGSRNSTPQSQPPSARKTDQRRRSSIGSTASSASGFFSQETACSFQETSTQHAPSASLSLSVKNSAAGDDDDDDSAFSSSQALDSKWECPRCTLVNEGSECDACGHQHRPARKKQKLQFQAKIFSSLS